MPHADPRDELLQQLNEMQAVEGIDAETRNLIGILSETIVAYSEEIDDLQQRVAELEDATETDERRARAWYSER
ncbi:hypothetical protein [Halomicrococcus gelatinilyticus]|uniref:hypothetical protein n=1 Tax=Halomicrococcus gelatinilyticus TaxID=1702103 RepID=UPI002E1459D8